MRDRGITEELGPTIYLLHEQTDQWHNKGAQPSGIVVRTTVEPVSLFTATDALRQGKLSWRLHGLFENPRA